MEGLYFTYICSINGAGKDLLTLGLGNPIYVRVPYPDRWSGLIFILVY